MKYMTKALTTILFVVIILNVMADDPYCERRFDGNVIGSNPLGSIVYSNPDINSDTLFTLSYNSIIQACWWDTYRDTVNNISGNWRKVRKNDTIGYVFSKDCINIDTTRYESEKIVSLVTSRAINYKLSDNFFGVFETNNGDSLLECNIELKRFTIDEINDYNSNGVYVGRDHNWHYVDTDKPYECKFLFSTNLKLRPQEISKFTYTTRLFDIGSSFGMKSPNSEAASFSKNQTRNKYQSGYEMIDNFLFVRTGWDDISDTVYYCSNCGEGKYIMLKFEFLGDVTGDKKIDFILIRSGGEGIIRKLFISQGIGSRYKVINEY